MSAAELLEPHRAELTGHCYRMLGSAVDADDAVQETMLRAWKGLERFEGRAEVRTWLYRIATNVCIDHLRSRERRRLPTLESPVGSVHDELVEAPRSHWLEPIPDAHVVPQLAEPERQAELRQSLRLAFVAALQHLPPRQRAALLLKDVLGFSSAEIAETLELSPAAVNSALQRARKAVAAGASGAGAQSTRPLSLTQAELVERYVDAFHRYDVEALVALLREDGSLCMPPFTLWLQGREAVHDWMLGRGIGCRGSRLVPVAACGSAAFAQYRRDETGGYAGWSLIVLELGDQEITSITHFLDVETLFPIFGLALTLTD
ncbi:sigma-70 family RNA polymerase sigma factor [Pseudenhygromyxa sp. WMMC2535]|uniref:sigma-70 family RNA polymerase sigma factor n=1 Tax=Pseudenhygromyxa sp. WMMC2535 TaxID=2712867 RepID=UPI0015550E1D|nr:sigma-70 family RNA polymerase sigma factor [Pseudenhygromyxa sp. WMMC2535]NVB36663.1 sigma-70 family RNA polymerase sigma factor [Pseudenhygromyxa sp. WMMC2535]